MDEQPLTIRQKINSMSGRDKLLVVFTSIANIAILSAFLFFPFDADEYIALGYLGVALANLLNSSTIVSPVPAFVVTFIAAKSLDPLVLILLSTVMVTIGESVAYLLGDGIDSLVRHYRWHKLLRRAFYKAPFLFLVIWIALPNPVQAAGQVFAGSVGYPFWKYALATFIGNIFWFILVVYAGQWFFESGLLG